MKNSYNGLWKLSIDKSMQKKDLIEKLNINFVISAKIGRDESVSMDVMQRIEL